ncbi:hypothetical protein Tco_0766394 [Tanacetum coccineum]
MAHDWSLENPPLEIKATRGYFHDVFASFLLEENGNWMLFGLGIRSITGAISGAQRLSHVGQTGTIGGEEVIGIVGPFPVPEDVKSRFFCLDINSQNRSFETLALAEKELDKFRILWLLRACEAATYGVKFQEVDEFELTLADDLLVS